MPKEALKKEDHQQNLQEDSTAQQPKQANKTGIPDNLKASMEYLHGISLNEVVVHYNSEKPAAMGAYAYTEGLNIYIAPGQEKYLAHELVHVVQQLKGQVKETVQFKKGVAGNDSQGLEAQAEKEGQKALQLAKVPDLLPKKELEHKASPEEIVQRAAITTNYGTFKDENYGPLPDWSRLIAHLSFEPGSNTDATKIGMTQSIKRVNDGKTVAKDPNQVSKMTTQGHKIDTSFKDDQPIYSAAPLGTGKTLKDIPQDNNSTGQPTELDPVDTSKQANATYELGHHYKKKPTDTTWQIKKAGMVDKPTINAAPNSSIEFETTAVALDGAQKGMYYGSVTWGIKLGTSVATSGILPFTKSSDGVPTKNFIGAAEKWNQGKAGGTLTTNKIDTQLILNNGASEMKLPVGTVVDYLGVTTGDKGKDVYAMVGVMVSGVMMKGEININDLTDAGDGAATHDLPLVDVFITKNNSTQVYKDQKKKKNKTTLPKDTRVKVLKTEDSMKKIEVVDGNKIETKGWVESTDLQQE